MRASDCLAGLRRTAQLGLTLGCTAAPLPAATPPAGFVETQLVSADFATGALLPTAAAFEPGSGDLWVVEKGQSATGTARVRVRDAVSGAVHTALTLDCVDVAGERGLLGIAFHPEYLSSASQRYVYLQYTRRIDTGGCAVPGQAAGSRMRVSRFAENGGVLAGEEVILPGPYLTSATNHNAGALEFAPDGTLFVATGDNDTDADPDPLSRDLSDLRGKLLRIRADGSIPADNPFRGQPGVREEIWAWGLRNPFRFRIDPLTGSPYIGDVGESTYEAVYRGIPGADYGYPCLEGSEPFRICDPDPAAASVTQPIYQYGHAGQTPPVSGNSLTGGPVYRGSAFPEEYRGNYFFGDFGTWWIRRARIAGDGRLANIEMFVPDARQVVDLLVSPAGCLVWVALTQQGVREICADDGANGPPWAQASAAPASGLAPLNVQFAGSGSTDPDLDALAFSWDLGDSSSDTAADPSHLYTSDGVYEAVLTVDDQQGEGNSIDRSPPIRIVVGNRAPEPSISSPLAGATYNAGDLISFAGGASDPEDGALAVEQLSWSVFFHRGSLAYPVLGPIHGAAGGSFPVPTEGEAATDVFYRIHLAATDSGAPLGAAAQLTSSASVDLLPNVVELTLAAEPASSGLSLALDGQPAVAPLVSSSVVGFQRTIGAPSPQTTGSGTFFFQSWSDAGAAEHAVAAPALDTTFTATFAPCVAGQDHLVLSNGMVSTPEAYAACLTITVGPSLRVTGGGQLALTAGTSVSLVNGFFLEPGGALEVVLTPPI